MKKVLVREWNQRERCQYICTGDSLTDDSHGWSSDVNEIVRRYSETGALPPSPPKVNLGDVTKLQGKPLGQVIQESRDTIKKFEEVRNEKFQKEQAQREADRAAGEAARKGARPPGGPAPVGPQEPPAGGSGSSQPAAAS